VRQKLEGQEEYKYDSSEDEDLLKQTINQVSVDTLKSASTSDFVKVGAAGSEVLVSESTFAFWR
jgi:hypothetical protein